MAKNPLKKSAPQLADYSAERKRRNIIFIVGGSILFVYLVLLGTIWLIVKSGIFRARSVEIAGMRTVSKDEVESLLRMDILGDSFVKNMLGYKHLFNWPRELEGSVLATLPTIRRIDIKKSYAKRSIVATVAERTPYGIWCAEGENIPPAGGLRCMWFDEEGIVFKRGFVTEGNLIKIVHDNSRETLALGERVLSEPMTGIMRNIFDVLEQSGVSVRRIVLRDINLEEIEVETYATQSGAAEGPDLLFSLRFPPAQALVVLNSFREKGTLGALDYIDFRVEHRAYSK